MTFKPLIAMLATAGITQTIAMTHQPTPEPVVVCPVYQPAPTIAPIPTPNPTPAPAPATQWAGLASYYSENGCLGCSPTLTMANGQRLDDTKLTVAFNRAPLNRQVEITNQATGQTVIATVTDRGGFERHGKIIDLNLATKNAIGCGDVCRVSIKLI